MTNKEIKRMSKSLYKSYEKLMALQIEEHPNSSDDLINAALSLGTAAALLKKVAEKN